MFSFLRRRLRGIGRWPRWCAVGVCLVLAAGSALAAKPGPARDRPVRDVVVAARALPAGHLLARVDLRVAPFPVGLSPPGAAADPARFVGARLTGALAPREVLTGHRVLGRDLTSGLPDGTVSVAVALADPGTAQLVRPGDRVDLLAVPRADDIDPSGSGDGGNVAPGAGSATVVATRTLVLANLTRPDPGGGAADAELVLAVSRDLAVRIAGLSARRSFAVVGNSP